MIFLARSTYILLLHNKQASWIHLFCNTTFKTLVPWNTATWFSRPKLIAERRGFDVNPPNFVKWLYFFVISSGHVDFPSSSMVCENVVKINLCCFVPFWRQWRGHYLKTRNQLNKIWGKNMKICQKNMPSMKNVFLMLKAEMAKESRKTPFSLVYSGIYFAVLLSGCTFSTVANYYISDNLIHAIKGKVRLSWKLIWW